MNPGNQEIIYPVRIKIEDSEVPQGQVFPQDYIEQQVALLAEQERALRRQESRVSRYYNRAVEERNIYLDLDREHSRNQRVLQDLLEGEENSVFSNQFDGCNPQEAPVEEDSDISIPGISVLHI